VTNVDRILRDAKLFRSRLDQIDGAENTGSFLIQLVEAKAVAAEPEPRRIAETATKVAPPTATETSTENDDVS
jgi:vacuolar protein sorting-associated protein 54